MGKGFTLLELLAVIIILAVLGLVTVPLAMNTIETSKRNAFISSAKNTLDATDLYTSKDGEVAFDGMTIQNLDIKKKDLYEGLVFVRTDDLKILKDFTDGNYCANGTKNDLQVTKGTCKSTGLYPVVKVQLKKVTTKSATVEVEAEDSIGIESYSYCAEKCEEESSWVTTKEASHTFQNLTHHRLYELHIKVKNQIEHVTEEVIQASTFEVPAPTYVIEPSGWSRSKKVTITYPEAYDHYYQVTEGTVQVNGKTVAVGEKIKVKGTKVELTFQSNGRMNASVSDGYNEVTVNDLVLAQIDTENPVVTSASITSTNGNYNAVTTIINSVVNDNSGILEMYISNSGYETGGSWEAYTASKDWNVGGTLNGGTRTVYITYRDLAGNKVNKSLTYTVYKDCSNITTVWSNQWGTCNKSCGGGTQTMSGTKQDTKTGSSCGSNSKSQACNTQSCIEYRYRSVANPKVTASFSKPGLKTIKYCSTGKLPDCKVCVDYGFGKTCTNYPKTVSKLVTCSGNKSIWTFEDALSLCIEVGMCTSPNDSYKVPYEMESIQIGGGGYIPGTTLYTCVYTNSTCPSGTSLSGGKCYGAWSAWSSTPVTATATREVQTRKP